jgi:hypothetical protein
VRVGRVVGQVVVVVPRDVHAVVHDRAEVGKCLVVHEPVLHLHPCGTRVRAGGASKECGQEARAKECGQEARAKEAGDDRRARGRML